MNLTQNIYHFIKNSDQKQTSTTYNKIKQRNYYKYTKLSNKTISDYQLGYNRAISDLKTLKRFRTFPKNSINLVNLITGGLVVEISQFIKGYQAAKKEVR